MIKLASGDEKELEGSCRNSKSNTPTRHDANRIVFIEHGPARPDRRLVRETVVIVRDTARMAMQ